MHVALKLFYYHKHAVLSKRHLVLLAISCRVGTAQMSPNKKDLPIEQRILKGGPVNI